MRPNIGDFVDQVYRPLTQTLLGHECAKVAGQQIDPAGRFFLNPTGDKSVISTTQEADCGNVSWF